MLSGAKYISILLLSIVFVYWGYFTNYFPLLFIPITFIISFGIYFYLIFYTQDKNEVNGLLWFSILFRLIFLFSIPVLSSDFLRYIFDGQVILHGFNPYLYVPADVLASKTPIPSELFGDYFFGLAQNKYYSTSFPLVQLLSVLSAFFTTIHPLIGLVILRIPIILADFVIIKFLIKLLEKLNLSYSGLLIYALNPLVIFGLTGNINFIGLMLCFFVIGLYFIIHNKWLNAIFFFVVSSAFSIFPFLLFPLVFKKLKTAKSIVFVLIVAVLFSLFWAPFYHENFFTSISNSIRTNFSLEQNHFGLINLFDWFTGDSDIILPTLFVVALVSISISRASDWVSILKGMMFCLTAFILINFKIEPYYFVLLVFLSVLVQEYHYAIIWSLIATLNYPIFAPFLETHYWIMPLEFSILLLLFLLELFGKFKSLSD